MAIDSCGLILVTTASRLLKNDLIHSEILYDSPGTYRNRRLNQILVTAFELLCDDQIDGTVQLADPLPQGSAPSTYTFRQPARPGLSPGGRFETAPLSFSCEQAGSRVPQHASKYSCTDYTAYPTFSQAKCRAPLDRLGEGLSTTLVGVRSVMKRRGQGYTREVNAKLNSTDRPARVNARLSAHADAATPPRSRSG